MDLSPIILRQHPELSRQQREVIAHTGGPLRVIAGPGAGKTLSIHLRAVNLLLTGRAAPDELVLCTFGRDAAGELQRRFTKSAGAYGVSGDLSGLRISTIHSLCHRLLAPHAELVGFRDDYRVLDEQEQQLLLHQESGAIFGPDWDILSGRGWRDGVHTVAEAARYFDRICDERIDPAVLAASGRPFIAAPESHADYPAVIAVEGTGPVDEGRRVGGMLSFLRSSGVIAGYGQAALLLHSVKDTISGPYLDGLEQAGVRARCEPAGHMGTHMGDELLVTTIHQAKGREWDVVIVGSLGGPDLETDRVGRNLAEYCGTDDGEPRERIGDLDRARRHYVAFTRARSLLVLTASGEPQARFRSLWEGAARWPGLDRESLARQRFGAAGAEPRRVVEIDRLDRLVVSLMKSGLALSMAPGDWAAVREEVQSSSEATPKETPETATARSSTGPTGA